MDRASDFGPRGPIVRFPAGAQTQEAVNGRPTWTDCDEAGDYVVPNVLSPRDRISRPDIMDETVPHTYPILSFSLCRISHFDIRNHI